MHFFCIINIVINNFEFKLKGTVRNSIAVEALFKTRNQQFATINFLNVTSITTHRMPTNVMTQELRYCLNSLTVSMVNTKLLDFKAIVILISWKPSLLVWNALYDKISNNLFYTNIYRG